MAFAPLPLGGFCYWPASLSSASSEPATAIARPRARRIFPPVETTRAVPTTGSNPDHHRLDVVTGDPALLGRPGVRQEGGRRRVNHASVTILTSISSRGARGSRARDAA